MGKGVRADVTGGHSLKPVIANGRGSAQRRFDVALFEEAALRGGVRPHASQTIGLELHRVSSAWSLSSVLPRKNGNTAVRRSECMSAAER